MEKINVAELLKDCPEGMELDCVLFDGVVFDGIDDDEYCGCPIVIKTKEGETWNLTSTGCWDDSPSAKCVIFPKGKTTWEGFVPPFKFKDGDVITCTNSACSFVAIFKEMNTDATFRRYVSLTLDDVQQFWTKVSFSDFCNPRHATEEEKAKLFQAIKDNGYKWNAETKTLEKLIEPKFKVGDRIKTVYNPHQYVIKGITDTHYTLEEVEEKFKYTEPIIEDKNWELVPNKFDITTLIPFESRVLVRDSEMGIWLPDFFGCLDNSNECPYMVVGGIRWKYCIPYENNEHLLGKCDDCIDFYRNWE